MHKKVGLILFSVALIVAAFFGATTVYQNQKTESMKFLADQNFKLFVPDHAPKLGASAPKVYIVEFLDPECESCRWIAPYVKQLMNEYKDRAQLVVRYAPFHGNSKFAVAILEAARKQDKYWETLEMLFETQPHWGDHHNPQPERLWSFLPRIGLDIDRLKQDMEDPAIAKIIEADMADLQTLGVRRTPTFFVNGKPLLDFGPQYLRELVEQELAAK